MCSILCSSYAVIMRSMWRLRVICTNPWRNKAWYPWLDQRSSCFLDQQMWLIYRACVESDVHYLSKHLLTLHIISEISVLCNRGVPQCTSTPLRFRRRALLRTGYDVEWLVRNCMALFTLSQRHWMKLHHSIHHNFMELDVGGRGFTNSSWCMAQDINHRYCLCFSVDIIKAVCVWAMLHPYRQWTHLKLAEFKVAE